MTRKKNHVTLDKLVGIKHVRIAEMSRDLQKRKNMINLQVQPNVTRLFGKIRKK